MTTPTATGTGSSDTLDGEQWLPVPGYADLYEVSEHGNLRSLDCRRVTRAGHGRHVPGKTITPGLNRDGYPQVTLTDHDGTRKNMTIHRLVCRTFHGPAPTPQHQVAHGNGNRTDNRAGNLRWATASENTYDTVRHGNHRNARKTRCPYGHRLTPANTCTPHRDDRGQDRWCRACSYARRYVSRHPYLAHGLRAIADGYYRDIRRKARNAAAQTVLPLDLPGEP